MASIKRFSRTSCSRSLANFDVLHSFSKLRKVYSFRTLPFRALEEDAATVEASSSSDAPEDLRRGKEASSTVSQWEGLIGNAGTVVTFVCLVAYVALFSPNQTPTRDMIFIQHAIFGSSPGDELNTVLWSVFYIMGVLPLIFAALMVPSARSQNKVPIWPFLSASMIVGIFGLFPYLCLWQPCPDAASSPPAAEELASGKGALLMRAFESRAFAAMLFAGAGFLVVNALRAGIPAWNGYIQYFDESRFVHTMTLDFCALTTLLPFFVWWDAGKRGWGQNWPGVFVLAVVPIFGPLTYLLLRPRAKL